MLPGVAEGSLVVFYFRNGAASAEILPGPSDKLRTEVREIVDEFADAFWEMKRVAITGMKEFGR